MFIYKRHKIVGAERKAQIKRDFELQKFEQSTFYCTSVAETVIFLLNQGANIDSKHVCRWC
jgi:hypothetical protein